MAGSLIRVAAADVLSERSESKGEAELNEWRGH